METLNIALPESMKDFVQERVAQGGFGSVSEYVHDLIRADQQRRHKELIDQQLLDGLASGTPVEVDQAYWDAKRRTLEARVQQARRS